MLVAIQLGNKIHSQCLCPGAKELADCVPATFFACPGGKWLGDFDVSRTEQEPKNKTVNRNRIEARFFIVVNLPQNTLSL
jgi:hypothetical protein